MKARYIGNMTAPWRLGQSRTPSPDNRALVRAQYKFLRGVWIEVLDGDASEFRRMAQDGNRPGHGGALQLPAGIEASAPHMIHQCASLGDRVIRQAQTVLPGPVRRVLADGAYDTRDNFNFLREEGIEAGIKIRRQSAWGFRTFLPSEACLETGPL